MQTRVVVEFQGSVVEQHCALEAATGGERLQLVDGIAQAQLPVRLARPASVASGQLLLEAAKGVQGLVCSGLVRDVAATFVVEHPQRQRLAQQPQRGGVAGAGLGGGVGFLDQDWLVDQWIGGDQQQRVESGQAAALGSGPL